MVFFSQRVVLAKLLSSQPAQWVGFGMVLALLFTLVIASLLQDRRELMDLERQRLLDQTRVVENNLSRQLEATNSALLSVQRDLAYFEDSPNATHVISLRLKALEDAMPGVRTLGVIDRNGTILASNRDNLVGQNFAHREYVRTPLQHPDSELLYLSEPFLSVNQVYTVNLARVVLDSQGRVDRLLIATLDPTFFATLLSSVLYANDMQVAIAHEDGIVVVAQPDRPGMVGTDLSKTNPLFQSFKASGKPAEVSEGFDPLSGEPVLVAQRNIRSSSVRMSKDLVVGIGRNPSAVLSMWRDSAQRLALTTSLCVFVAALGLWMLQRLQREQKRAQMQAETEIRQLAFYDPLTHLPNRRLLLDRLSVAMPASLREGRYSALLFIDLDNFKTLNDTQGHSQGDALLVQVAQRLLACVRDEDTVARIGGDEFVLMLQGLSPTTLDATERAEVVARKVLAALNKAFTLNAQSFTCSASIGIALFGQRTESMDDVLKRADDAMYAAKRAGRNTYCLG